MQPNLARTIGPRFAYDEHALRVAIADLHRMFPSFRDVPIEAGWGGPIDVSGAHLPFFGTSDGAVHYGLGYTGNGVGPAHLGGRILALRALGRYEEVLDLPFVDAIPCGSRRSRSVSGRADREQRDPSQGRVRGPRPGAEPARGLRGATAAASRLPPGAVADGPRGRGPDAVLERAVLREDGAMASVEGIIARTV